MASEVIKKTVVPRKRGAPSLFTQELADQLCSYLSSGMSLRSACNVEGMPDRVTVFRWLRTRPDFCIQYTRAKQEAADALADHIEFIADQTLSGAIDPNAARIAIDAKKWIASKLKPKVYGDRMQLANDEENPITRPIELPPDVIENFKDMLTKSTKQ